MEVLFCGMDMPRGFEYTCEALGQDPSIRVVRCHAKDVLAHVPSATMLVPLMTRLSEQVLRHATQAKLILQFGVGLEGVDIPAATELGILVSNIPSHMTGNALSCAEHVIYLMLALLRDQHAMDHSIRHKVLGAPCGETLWGKRTVVVGYGGIAQALIPRLHALGQQVSCIRANAGHWLQPPAAAQQAAQPGPTVAPNTLQGVRQAVASDPATLLTARGGTDDLKHFVVDADFIAMTCPQTPATIGMINKEVLERCKDGVRIINVARGGLLDYQAVLEGLQSKKIGGLGLDVHWQEPFDPCNPIATHPKVVLTPHIAGVTELSYRSMAEVVAQEARRLAAGQPPSRPLNNPINSRLAQ